MSGSSDLTPEQQDWYLERYGVRYLSVAEQPYRPSRRVRRGRATKQDVEVFEAQERARAILAGAQVRPVL